MIGVFDEFLWPRGARSARKLTQFLGVEGVDLRPALGGCGERNLDMRAPRLATTVKLALLLWSGARQACRSMSSGRGIDPGEPEAMRFVITESLLGLGNVPQIHLGTNLTVIDRTKLTVIAIVETGESKPSFNVEIRKAELWRAVVLEEEMGLGHLMFLLQPLVARR